jgi:hypothetical protein
VAALDFDMLAGSKRVLLHLFEKSAALAAPDLDPPRLLATVTAEL